MINSGIRVLQTKRGAFLSSSLSALIMLYGYTHEAFYKFSRLLPSEQELKDRMKLFHDSIGSGVYNIIYDRPELIDLIELKLIHTKLFNQYVDKKDVIEFCKSEYNYEYLTNSVPHTLNLAHYYGFLIKDKNTGKYKKNPRQPSKSDVNRKRKEKKQVICNAMQREYINQYIKPEGKSTKLTLHHSEYDSIIKIIESVNEPKTEAELYTALGKTNRSKKLTTIIKTMSHTGWLLATGKGDTLEYQTTDAGKTILGLGGKEPSEK